MGPKVSQGSPQVTPGMLFSLILANFFFIHSLGRILYEATRERHRGREGMHAFEIHHYLEKKHSLDSVPSEEPRPRHTDKTRKRKDEQAGLRKGEDKLRNSCVLYQVDDGYSRSLQSEAGSGPLIAHTDFLQHVCDNQIFAEQC